MQISLSSPHLAAAPPSNDSSRLPSIPLSAAPSQPHSSATVSLALARCARLFLLVARSVKRKQAITAAGYPIVLPPNKRRIISISSCYASIQVWPLVGAPSKAIAASEHSVLRRSSLRHLYGYRFPTCLPVPSPHSLFMLLFIFFFPVYIFYSITIYFVGPQWP